MNSNNLATAKLVNKLHRILCGDFVRVQARYLQKEPSYIQGQAPEAKVREYFYYIDHQGMVRNAFKLQ